jgi:hypothetical protein
MSTLTLMMRVDAADADAIVRAQRAAAPREPAAALPRQRQRASES